MKAPVRTLVLLAVLLVVHAAGARSTSRMLAQAQPCKVVDALAKKTGKGLCLVQAVRSTPKAKPALVDPKTPKDLQASANAACVLEGYASADLAGSKSIQRPPANMKQCYNGLGYVPATAVWSSLKCCGKAPSGARLQVEDSDNAQTARLQVREEAGPADLGP